MLTTMWEHGIDKEVCSQIQISALAPIFPDGAGRFRDRQPLSAVASHGVVGFEVILGAVS
jgi:hypothetical protein